MDFVLASQSSHTLKQTTTFLSLTPSSFNRSKILTGSSSSLKFNCSPTVAPRTRLATIVVTDAFVFWSISVGFVIGKSVPF